MARHVDYITPGIKLMSGGFHGETPNTKRRKLHGPRKDYEPKPKRQVESDIAHMEMEYSERWFKITGPCTYEATPDCVRSEVP